MFTLIIESYGALILPLKENPKIESIIRSELMTLSSNSSFLINLME